MCPQTILYKQFCLNKILSLDNIIKIIYTSLYQSILKYGVVPLKIKLKPIVSLLNCLVRICLNKTDRVRSINDIINN